MIQHETRRSLIWSARLNSLIDQNQRPPSLVVQGRLSRIIGLTLEAEGCHAAIGDRCSIVSSGRRVVEAEVVGFAGDNLFLMPTGELYGLSPNARVIPLGKGGDVAVGPDLLGRVLDAYGKPLDGGAPFKKESQVPLKGEPLNPLQRTLVSQPLDVGVRAINSFFTVGRGQRLGLLAPSGVGKSILLGMMSRFTDADVIVVGLIGERGREVKEFVEQNLGEAGLQRAVVVASPADDPPLMRLNGALLATSIAEYFRDRGQHVLLLMDSLTRFAQAQREIALAIGELPATRGYPPSVFARLPQLVERAGNGIDPAGSITAIYTVLTEVDDQNDPIADAAKAILDGHIVLSKTLAESGIYPAIDIEASISRVMNQIVSKKQQYNAARFKYFYSLYQKNKDLLNVGAYQSGYDNALDCAIQFYPDMVGYLRQDQDQRLALRACLLTLEELIGRMQPEDTATQEEGGENNESVTAH